MSKMAGRGQVAYVDAGNIVEQTVGAIRTVSQRVDAGNVVEQTVGAIRTVVAFTGEKQATEKYESQLEIAYKTMVTQGLISGLGLGTMLAVIFCSYSLAVWYGVKLIIGKGYNGGQVINVI
ncbi:hypothetical protein Bca52824_013670 [Brassica carinata]|uniref:ABC transmembrane type-1 domain-containing protein n=1 Tax=Brassica carinata TaxID=52824 RepID=A0A8X8B433_BRACI|nr:hypothetical protein Bca52824_013670 [Brassica carinata]